MVKLNEFLIIILAYFYMAPLYTFREDILSNSGIFEYDYPLLYAILFRYHSHLSILFIAVLTVSLSYSIKRGSRGLTLTRYSIVFLTVNYTVHCWYTQATTAWYGRFWYYFPQLSVVVNDAMAFFAGRAFGKT